MNTTQEESHSGGTKNSNLAFQTPTVMNKRDINAMAGSHVSMIHVTIFTAMMLHKISIVCFQKISITSPWKVTGNLI